MVRIFKIYSLNSFHVLIYNTILLSVVTLLYIRSQELIHCTTGSLCPWINISPFPSPLPPDAQPWQPPFYSLFLLVQLFQIPHISDIIQYLSFSVWLISLRIMPSQPSMLSQVAGFPSFLWMNNSSLNMCVYVYVCVCVCVYIYIYIYIYIISHFLYLLISQRTFGLFSYLGYYECCCNKQGSASIPLRHWFYFLWICTQK